MRRWATLSTLLLMLAATAALADSIPELFQKMKEQVKAEKWTDALATIEVIDVEAAKPANANVRSQLEGPLAFYRGVCEANSGNAAKAQASFESYLRAQTRTPTATRDREPRRPTRTTTTRRSGTTGTTCCRKACRTRRWTRPSSPRRGTARTSSSVTRTFSRR